MRWRGSNEINDKVQVGVRMEANLLCSTDRPRIEACKSRRCWYKKWRWNKHLQSRECDHGRDSNTAQPIEASGSPTKLRSKGNAGSRRNPQVMKAAPTLNAEGQLPRRGGLHRTKRDRNRDPPVGKALVLSARQHG